MIKRPLIGITPGYKTDGERLFLKDGYYNAILEAGGLPAVIPPAQDEGLLEDYILRLDGFLLSGGPDIDARHFNEPNLPFGGEISPLRDRAELYLARRAVELDKPILGICRGIQVLNVAWGGSIYQDIYQQAGTRRVIRHSQAAPVWYPFHELDIEKGSRVWNSFEKESIYVNSFHHQAVKETAEGFRATSWSADGLVEAIEHESKRFAVGVQWHPELMWQRDRIYLGIFRLLVEECRRGDGPWLVA